MTKSLTSTGITLAYRSFGEETAEAILLISGLGDAAVIFRRACAMGLEGIVSKRTGSKYRSGRCTDWLKTKNSAFART